MCLYSINYLKNIWQLHAHAAQHSVLVVNSNPLLHVWRINIIFIHKTATSRRRVVSSNTWPRLSGGADWFGPVREQNNQIQNRTWAGWGAGGDGFNAHSKGQTYDTWETDSLYLRKEHSVGVKTPRLPSSFRDGGLGGGISEVLALRSPSLSWRKSLRALLSIRLPAW